MKTDVVCVPFASWMQTVMLRGPLQQRQVVVTFAAVVYLIVTSGDSAQ